MPLLLVILPDGRSKRFRFPRLALVGRDPACDLVLDDPLVSRQHLLLAVDDAGRCIATDLHSTNGSWCGPERLVRRPILPGTELRVGATRIQLLDPRPLARGDLPPGPDEVTYPLFSRSRPSESTFPP